MNQLRLRVASYNILTQPFVANPAKFPVFIENTNPDTRYSRIEAQLANEIKQNALICLQEVGRSHVGRLTAFFQKHGYQFIAANYGKAESDWFGIGIAYPFNGYILDDASITHLTSTKPWPQDDRPAPAPHTLSSLASTVTKWIRWGLRIDPPSQTTDSQTPSSSTSAQRKKVVADLYEDASRRSNTVVQLNLTHRLMKEKRLSIATYHLPCAHYAMSVMNTHAALLAQETNRFAAGRPLLLMGDFNFTPAQSPYKLMTGELKFDPSSPEFLPLPKKDTWQAVIPRPFVSAYKLIKGSEPEYTNFNLQSSRGPFIGTVDFIFFHSDSGLTCTGVKDLPSAAEAQSYGMCPNHVDPSDHILIAADFLLQ